MGAGQHQPVKYSKQALKTTHPFLQKSWIVREQKKSYIQNSFPIADKHYQDWRSQVGKAAGYPNNQFVYLPHDLGYVENTQMCSKNGYAIANYPDFPHILSDQIAKRRGQHAYFKQKQLYYLLYALVAVKIDAKQRGELVGDIKPENVFISNDERIKIGSLESFPYEKSNYAKFNDSLAPSNNVLLAPEDLALAISKQLDNSKNIKSQVFSIGATVLSAGLLDNLASIYDFPNKAFRNADLEEKSNQWLNHESYSQIFKSIVLNLVSVDAEKRISIEDLWAFLGKYQSSILSKEQFIVNQPPESLQVGVKILRSKIQ